MPLFDSHNHVHDPRLAAEVDAVMRRARAADVTGMLCCGTREADWEAVRSCAAQYEDIVPAYGLHPWFVAERSPDWMSRLTARFDENPRAVVGEIGLDHALENRDDTAQEEVFLSQLAFSRERRRPVSIHCRRAWGRLLELLRADGAHPAGLVFHSFSGSAELVPELTALNGYFSFSGAITFESNRRGRAALAAVPLDQLLIETDAPDLAPAGCAEPNEPARLRQIAECVAARRGLSYEELAARTAAQATRLFVL